MNYYTFIMFKPDALERELVDEAMEYFRKAKIGIERFGYQICTEARICAHYAEVIERVGGDFKNQALRYFLNRPVIPVLLKSENPDLISEVRKITGFTDPAKAEKGTIRGDLGRDSMEASKKSDRCCENVIHASDSPQAVREEAALWFGADQVAGILKNL